MLTQEIKKKIDSARDILVGKVPDPKAQVEQITTALIYKFMDDMDKQAQSLPKGKAQFFTNGFEKYGWGKMMDAKLGGQERLNLYVEAIAKMAKNPHLPQLFRDVFKDAFLPYRDPETLNLFLKDINTFSYDHSENLGDAFEYLLSILGSQGDAGQFRTPRHIIDFIVEVVDPKKDETILDPACGTAGFLISAYKHILKSNKNKPLTPDEKKRLMGNLAGYDISPDMVKLSLVNMYLHGFPSPNIHEYDTLTSEERWDERFDVMMANPPFMTPKGGIRPHGRFMVQANRSEVLFVDYILEHLNNKGRAGIIVPEGIIFQSTTAYKHLRKLLVEDGLYAVVSLPSGVFNPYSGVKTSILFFDNQLAKQSKEILFVKVLDDGFDLGAQRRPIDRNDLPHAVEVLRAQREVIKTGKKNYLLKEGSSFAWAISKTEIVKSGDFNLTGDRYRKTQKHLSQYPVIKLGSLVIEETERVGKDAIPVWSVSNTQGFVSTEEYFEKKVASADIKNYKKVKQGTFAYNPSRINVGSIAFNKTGTVGAVSPMYVVFSIPTTKKINPDYLLWLLKSSFMSDQIKQLSQGAVRQQLRFKDLANISIPLPDDEKQNEIIDELNGYQKVIDGAKQIIEHHRPSIKIDGSWETAKLDELAEIEYGYGETAKDIGNARYIRITDISSDGYLKGEDAKYINLTKDSEQYQLKQGDLLVARTGATYGKTMIFNESYPAVFASFLIRLNFKTEKIIPDYYWVFAQTDNYWNQAKVLVTGGAQPQFNGNTMKKISVPLPSLEIQKQIIIRVKEEQVHIISAKRMIEIYEDKIKSKIAEVWGE